MEMLQVYPYQVENAEEDGHTISFRVTHSPQQAAHLFFPWETISTPCSSSGFHELLAADNVHFPYLDGDQHNVSTRYISATASLLGPFSGDEHGDVRNLDDSIAFEDLSMANHQVSDQTPSASPSAMDDDILFQNFVGAENSQWATEDRRSSEASLDSSYCYDLPARLQGSGPPCYVTWEHPMAHRPQDLPSLVNPPIGGLVAIQNGVTLTNASQSASLQGVYELVHASTPSLPLALPNLTNQDMKSSQMVWSQSSGKPVEEKSSRKRPHAQRAQSMAIRRTGGQCETCRNKKRKVCGATNLTPCSDAKLWTSVPWIILEEGAPIGIGTFHAILLTCRLL